MILHAYQCYAQSQPYRSFHVASVAVIEENECVVFGTGNAVWLLELVIDELLVLVMLHALIAVPFVPCAVPLVPFAVVVLLPSGYGGTTDAALAWLVCASTC